MRIVQPHGPRQPDAQPLHIPSWLSNPDAIGPCPCGKPIGVNQPFTILGGELFRQYYHIACAQQKLYESGEWDPYEEPWDNDDD